MELGEEIVLRPRFTLEFKESMDSLLKIFEASKKNEDGIVVTLVEQHVFLKIPKNKQHFWSPQLDLEFSSFEEGVTNMTGLFGPKPAVWTMFMFFHFVVASLFIAFGIWAYTNYSLKDDYHFPLALMGSMILAWILLYLAGRGGKKAGKEEMEQLYRFMQKTLKNQSL